LNAVVQYLVLVNSSVNFLVYTMFASQFQTVFMDMFNLGFRTKVRISFHVQESEMNEL
jgi:hypothetical protein